MWANCKRYNQAGSPIWKLAVAFAEGFEKVMADWVMAFRPNSSSSTNVVHGNNSDSKSGLAWSDKGARPWELPGGGLKPVRGTRERARCRLW